MPDTLLELRRVDHRSEQNVAVSACLNGLGFARLMRRPEEDLG
jgi:hypothetical protein